MGNPGTVRMVRHPRDPDPPSAEFDEEEHIELFERERVDGEEVGGHDMRSLRSQECPPRGPRSSRGGPDSVVLQDPGDGARRQPDVELDQLSLDAAVTPPRVLGGQTDNEARGLLVDRRPPGPTMRIGPVPGHEPPMPGEQRCGRHREAGPRRAGEEPAHRRQEGTIGRLVNRTPDLASEHGHLMAQGQKLDLVGVLRA